MISNVLNAEHLEGKKCLVICPSRERLEKLQKMAESFKAKTSPQSALLVCLDDDDPQIEKYKQFLGKNFAYYIGQRKTTTEIYNYILKVFPDFKYYCLTNDDFVYLTAVWDVKLMGRIEEGDGWGVAYGDDRIAGERLPTTPMISGNIAKTLGWLQLPSLKHLYGDRVWRALSRGLGRLFYEQNVIIQHEHPLDNKTAGDATFERTNSKQMYEVDRDAFDRWLKGTSKQDISKVLKEIFKEKKFDKQVSLCMIISQDEDLRNIKQCLDSIKDWIDELCIFANYKHLPNYFKIDAIKKLAKSYNLGDYGLNIKIAVGKFENFSQARNVTLKQATKDYIIYMDCDDVMPAPWTLKDLLCKNPDFDVFMCHVVSHNEHKADEHITQSRILKRQDWLEFRNNVHEDISYSYKEHNARVLATDVIIEHFGNISQKRVQEKNIRNYKLTLQEINKPSAHSLTYFAIVNELMLMNKHDKTIEAIQWIDKFFDKFPDDGKDPLIPKMWILRGACALDCDQVDAARTNFSQAWHKWKHPEAAVMLGECHIRQQNWDKAIEILEEVNMIETFQVCNVPIDMETIEKELVRKLGLSYLNKAKGIMGLKKAAPAMYNEEAYKLAQDCLNKAETNFMKYMALQPNDLHAGDMLADIFRGRGKVNDSNAVTVSLVNMFPNYAVGWKNLGVFELKSKRYRTAEVFFQKALQIDPKDEDSKHNLQQLRQLNK